MSDDSHEPKDIEVRDSEKVGNAIRCILRKDLDTAHCILSEVIENTPATYVNEFTEGDTLFVKFWDQQHFLHYIDWCKECFEGK